MTILKIAKIQCYQKSNAIEVELQETFDPPLMKFTIGNPAKQISTRVSRDEWCELVEEVSRLWAAGDKA